jgi:hypothetical protein
MMETRQISETLVFNSALTRPIARVDLSAIILYEYMNASNLACRKNNGWQASGDVNNWKNRLRELK